jgi:hypothetical protein
MKPLSAPVIGFVLALGAIAVIGGVILPEIGRPPFDTHSFRQCQTLSTIEWFSAHGIDLLRPPVNYKGEPGIFALEFPLFQALAARLARGFGDALIVTRVLNLVIALGSAGMIFLIARRLFTAVTGLVAVWIFLCGPLSLSYITSTLLDPLGILFGLLTFYFALRVAVDNERGWGWLGFGVFAVLVALIKALYLFPVLALLALAGLENGRANWRRTALWFVPLVIAGASFLVWNHHAVAVNEASFFTAGTVPLSHLGFARLFSPEWYLVIGRRALRDCIGPVAAVAAFGGWIWSLVRAGRARSVALELPMLVTLIAVGGYWVAFANINFPHDYYSLQVVPFFAIAAAASLTRLSEWIASYFQKPNAAGVLLLGLALVAGVTGVVFFRRGFGTMPHPTYLALRDAAAGKLQRDEYAMIFIRGSMPDDAPPALYALGVRGTAKFVTSDRELLEIWRTYRPHYQHLRYVVFMRLTPPEEIRREFTSTVLSDPRAEVYVYER